MSIRFMNIGPVPTDESAAQVGRPDYDEHSRRECCIFQRMLAQCVPGIARQPKQIGIFLPTIYYNN